MDSREKVHLTAISVAAENASGKVVETTRDGAMTNAVAVKLVFFLPHHSFRPYSDSDLF